MKRRKWGNPERAANEVGKGIIEESKSRKELVTIGW